jgi:hypothetical protein
MPASQAVAGKRSGWGGSGSRGVIGMSTDVPAPLDWRPALRSVPLAIVFAALCVGPYLGRLRHPTLYADDVGRIVELQTIPLGKLAFVPFNEHFSPAFRVVTWMAWELCGRRLTWAPLTFTLASYIPFGLVLLVLGRWLREEFRSNSTALVAIAVFSLSALYIETVEWFSASSFMWSLLCTVIALRSAGRAAGERGSKVELATCAVAAGVAPAFSAIGLLAGPLASLRIVLGTERTRGLRGLAGSLMPVAGSLAFLVGASAFRYREVVESSLKQNADLRAGLRSTASAIVDRLLPALIGVSVPETMLPSTLMWGLFVLLALAVAIWAIRSQGRSLIVVGVAAIVGGYLLTFSTRSGMIKHDLIDTQRYHLFPQFGLSVLAGSSLCKWLRLLDSRPRIGLRIVTGIAAILLFLHAPKMVELARAYQFPAQRQTLIALEHLEAICRREGITREQALRALDPIQTQWMKHPTMDALQMLPRTVDRSEVPDLSVRERLLAALSTEDREGVCGGMDATPHLEPLESSLRFTACAEGRLVDSLRVEPSGRPGEFVCSGWPSYLEFDLPQSASARALRLPTCPPGTSIELWWKTPSQKWSAARSARIETIANQSQQPSVLPLAALPHWTPRASIRIRLLFHDKGLVAIGDPRFLR